jgi:hypothetical protein
MDTGLAREFLTARSGTKEVPGEETAAGKKKGAAEGALQKLVARPIKVSL